MANESSGRPRVFVGNVHQEGGCKSSQKCPRCGAERCPISYGLQTEDARVNADIACSLRALIYLVGKLGDRP